MDIIEPTQEEVAAIAATNPARVPTLIHLTVIGDRGASVRLPFVLGNPSGACGLPANKTTSIWSSFVSAALKNGKLPEGEDAAAQDVMLWPPPAAWAQWSDRWPALSGQVWRAAKKKCGAIVEAISEPAYDDERLPDPVKAALAQFPRACLRRYQLHKASFLLLIDPPASAPWRIYLEAIRSDKDVAKTAREMAQLCTKFTFDDQAGAPAAFEAVTAQWPGLAVQACLTISVLAGAAAGVELGE